MPPRVLEHNATFSPDSNAARFRERFLVLVPDDAAGSVEVGYAHALPIIFEKLGFLDIATCPLSEYQANAQAGPLPHVLLLPNATVNALSVSDIESLRQDGVILFAEGPWPASWDQWLGITIDREAPGQTDIAYAVDDRSLRDRMDRFLRGMKNPSFSGAYESADSLAIKARRRVTRRQSETVSRYADVNLSTEIPAWSIRPTQRLHAADADTANANKSSLKLQTLLSWGSAESTMRSGEPRGHLLLRDGSFFLSSWQMLSYLAQDYTAAAKHHVYSFSNDRYPLEFLLFQMLIDALGEQWERLLGVGMGGLAGIRLAPWPAAAQYALTVRHDVDRLPKEPSFSQLLEAERRSKVGVSCYFLKSTADREVMRRFADNGAEIALHTAHLEPEAEAEISAITTHGFPQPAGFTVHGNQGFYGWRGAAMWEQAQHLGMSYCEHLSSIRYWPSRVFKLDDDGRMQTYAFVALPHHVSLDRNQQDTYCAELIASLPALARNQVCVTVLNHPDIHVGSLVNILQKHLPKDYLGMTAAEIAAWWRATHFRENLSFVTRSAASQQIEIEIRSQQPVRGLTFELPLSMQPDEVLLNDAEPPGLIIKQFAHSAMAANGWRIAFDVPAGQSVLTVRWSLHGRTMMHLNNRIIEWFQQDRGQPTQSAERTAAFNSLELHRRLDPLTEPVRDILDRETEVSILDVGCGFGGLALSLASSRLTRRVHAVDISPRYYAVAARAAEELGLDNVTFASCNILELQDVEAYDLVLLSNILCYLTTHEDLRRGCENAWRATKPGGAIALYTPHAWCLREPFSKLYGVHWLPMPLRDRLVRRLGRRSTMRDVRLPATRELRNIFRQLGGRSIRQTPTGWRTLLRTSHIYQWVRK